MTRRRASSLPSAMVDHGLGLYAVGLSHILIGWPIAAVILGAREAHLVIRQTPP
jgi:hypothetical protein